MDWKIIFFLAAAGCFLLDGFKVQHPRLNWTPLGFAWLTIGLFLL